MLRATITATKTHRSEDKYVSDFQNTVGSANFVKEECYGAFVEEDVMLGLVADVGGKAFAHYTVPVRAVLLVELALDVLGHLELGFQVVHRPLGLHLVPLVPPSWLQPSSASLQACQRY